MLYIVYTYGGGVRDVVYTYMMVKEQNDGAAAAAAAAIQRVRQKLATQHTGHPCMWSAASALA